MTQAIVLLSGGIDSATCLYWARREGFDIIALSFIYHHRPLHEREASSKLANLINAKYIEVDISFLKNTADLRVEQYPGLEDVEDNGYIPARNLIFYSIATYYAEAFGAEYIIGGHIAHDAVVFPDATQDFFKIFEKILSLSLVSSKSPKNLTPLAMMSKLEVGILAKELKVPLELTWSCYGDSESQCGVCLSCQERKMALEQVTPSKDTFL